MNVVGIDKGALKMAVNTLEIAEKLDVSDALTDSAMPIETLLELAAKESPALYMKFVTNSMMISYA